MKTLVQHCLLLATLVALAYASLGCKSADTENLSSRPWNAPRGFDTGMPGMSPDQYRR